MHKIPSIKIFSYRWKEKASSSILGHWKIGKWQKNRCRYVGDIQIAKTRYHFLFWNKFSRPHPYIIFWVINIYRSCDYGIAQIIHGVILLFRCSCLYVHSLLFAARIPDYCLFSFKIKADGVRKNLISTLLKRRWLHQYTQRIFYAASRHLICIVIHDNDSGFKLNILIIELCTIVHV